MGGAYILGKDQGKDGRGKEMSCNEGGRTGKIWEGGKRGKKVKVT